MGKLAFRACHFYITLTKLHLRKCLDDMLHSDRCKGTRDTGVPLQKVSRRQQGADKEKENSARVRLHEVAFAK